MNISNIQQNQVTQGAAGPMENRPVPAVLPARTGLPPADIRQPQVQGLIALVNDMQQSLADMNVIHYPPFFPIAHYQRLDLIGQVNHLQEEVGRSSIDEGLKKMYGADKLKSDATDQEIGGALDKLFGLRDTLTGKRPLSSDNIQPGAILTIKV